MESSNVEDPKSEGEVMQQISNSVPPEELPQVGKEPQEEENYCDDDGEMETEKEFPPSEKTPLSDELQHGYRILCELMSDSHKAVNWPFLNAVDDSIPELEDYYEQITRPMWMKKRSAISRNTNFSFFIGEVQNIFQSFKLTIFIQLKQFY